MSLVFAGICSHGPGITARRDQAEAGQLARLEQVSAIELGFPHDFLGSDATQEIVFGGTQGRLERPGRW